MFNCFAGRDRMEILTLALTCACTNDALLNFLEKKDEGKFEEKIREAVVFFKPRSFGGKGLTYPQLVVFEKQLKKHPKLRSELLLLLNSRVSRKKKEEIAEKVLNFFSGLQDQCHWHFQTGTHFGPPVSAMKKSPGVQHK